MFIRAGKYSWRKTSNFFHREIGPGTQFDLLPLETLKLIFKYKLKFERLQKIEKLKFERLQKIEKSKEEARLKKLQDILKREEYILKREEERDKINKEVLQRRYIEQNVELVDRFGIPAAYWNKEQRRDGLSLISFERRIEQRRRAEEFQRGTMERARRRQTNSFNNGYDPVGLFSRLHPNWSP